VRGARGEGGVEVEGGICHVSILSGCFDLEWMLRKAVRLDLPCLESVVCCVVLS
jgi:hypothetical protein